MALDPLVDFFETLSSESALSELIREGRSEDIHLEFKQKKDRSRPELDESDAFQLSRALSGFANSDGGILLWGMESDKNERAKRLHPISAVRDFQGRLKKSILNTTQPIVDGVRIEIIELEGAADAGLVKCLVPASDMGPHRAMMAGREYYKRSTEGFYRLEHFDLEDMFGRRPVPRLELEVRIVRRGRTGGAGGSVQRGLLILSITNHGRGSARSPYLAIEPLPPYTFATGGLDGNGYEGLTRIRTGDPRRLIYSSSEIVIHPGVAHDTAAVDLGVRLSEIDDLVWPPALQMRYELSADGARLQESQISLSGEDIARALLPEQFSGGTAVAAP